MIVIDASAAIRWFIAVAPDASPLGLPDTQHPLVAPDLFVAEIRSAVLGYLRNKELSREQGVDIVATIDQLMAGYFPMADFRDAAWALALEHDHSPSDCFYIEVARSIGSYVVTADLRLVGKFAATRHARLIVPLQEWRP